MKNWIVVEYPENRFLADMGDRVFHNIRNGRKFRATAKMMRDLSPLELARYLNGNSLLPNKQADGI